MLSHYNNSCTNAPHFYVLCTLPITTHIPFSRSVQAAGCCSFPNNLPAIHRCPTRRRSTNLSFTLYLQTQITPVASLRVSASSCRHAPRHCNVRLLTVLTHYLYLEKVSGTTLNTCEHTWN